MGVLYCYTVYMTIDDRFDDSVSRRWKVSQVGNGQVVRRQRSLWLTLPRTNDSSYSNAQISDYDPAKRHFRYKPPIRLTITARASAPAHELKGTAGFGFWNHPFAPNERGFRLPQAVWFFFSAPPNNIPLAKGVSGSGWKAAVMNARRWQFLALLPTAPIGFLLMRIPFFYDRLWGIGQQALGVSEMRLDGNLLSTTHTYELLWRKNGVTFSIDNEVIHQTTTAPKHPLGFVAWMDNQYAIVTPQGQFKFGLVDVPQEQSLVIERIAIQPLPDQ